MRYLADALWVRPRGPTAAPFTLHVAGVTFGSHLAQVGAISKYMIWVSLPWPP